MSARLLLLAALAATAACGPGPIDATAAQRGGGATATALFAGGCFWSTEHDLEQVPGVVAAVSGFSGGTVDNPSYREVVGGGTGHLEAVLVTYDPARISYGQLVRRFLRTIDPTDAGGQFCDRGESYRTAVFVSNQGQLREARAALAEAARTLGRPVVTPVRRAGRFYEVGAEHQDYARRNPAHYRRYRIGCGRDARLRAVWG